MSFKRITLVVLRVARAFRFPAAPGLFAIASVALVLSSAQPSAAFEGWPPGRFKIVGDGTVLDTTTDRVWTVDADLLNNPDPWDGLTWSEALRFVSQMNAGTLPNFGHSDWRLPNPDEMLGVLAGSWDNMPKHERAARHFDRIIDDPPEVSEYERHQEPLVIPFSGLRETAYWSGTAAIVAGDRRSVGPYVAAGTEIPAAARTGWALAVHTGRRVLVLPQSMRKRVWPVRGPITLPAAENDHQSSAATSTTHARHLPDSENNSSW